MNSFLSFTRNWFGSSSKDNFSAVHEEEIEDFSEYIKPKVETVKNEYEKNKLHPIIHWNPETSLTFLEPLEFQKHFIAYAKDYKARTVDGNFIFNPTEGAILQAGSHELSVSFIPLKKYKYLSAQATRQIIVHKRRPTVIWNHPLCLYQRRDSLVEQENVIHLNETVNELQDEVITEKVKQQQTENSASLTKQDSTMSSNADSVDSDDILYVSKTPVKHTHPDEYLLNTHINHPLQQFHPILPPQIEVMYNTFLTAEHFEGVTCELTGGTFHYSHQIGQKLDIGRHTVTVEYIPSTEEKLNYTCGYAQLFIHCTGVAVPLDWTLPQSIVSTLVYPCTLPDTLLIAQCVDDTITGTFTYNPPLDTDLTAGIHKLSAIFTPNDLLRYRVTSIVRELCVQKAKIELDWGRPIAICEGDLLTEHILCCKNIGNIPGTYVYTPPVGTALLKGLHPLSVHFTPDDCSNYEEATTETQFRVLAQRVPALYWPVPYDITYPAPLTKAQLCASISGGFIKGEWKYEPDMGTVLNAGTHTLSATFYPVKPSIKITTVTTTLTVYPAISRLVWKEPDSILDGEAIFESILSCKCTNTTGDFIYTPGRATALKTGNHKLHVSFTPHDTLNYGVAELTVMLLVRERPKSTPKLSWQNPISEPIHYNTRLTDDIMTPVCMNRIRGHFEFQPDIGAKLPVGEHTLLATFIPDDKFSCILGESVTSSITVLKAIPSVVWKPKETLLYYEMPLTYEYHLNAYCDMDNIDGEFIYTPSVGSVLDCGEHIINLTFKPNDSVNYFDITLTITIFIRRSKPIIQWESPMGVVTYPTYLSRRKHLNPICITPYVTGKYEFNHSPGTILEVGTHDLTCRFYVDQLINYLSADASITITVVKGTPSVIWLPELIIIYETPLNNVFHCNAKTDLKGGTFIYNPPLHTILPVGTQHTFTMRYIPDDLKNYHEVFETRYLRVDPKIPVLHWILPETINFGVYLSATELCASLSQTENSTTSLEILRTGTFKYKPTFGETPNASESTVLSVTFTPPYSDKNNHLACNYATVTKDVIIAVLRCRPDVKWKPRYLNIMEGAPLTEAQCNAVIKKNNVFKGTLLYTPEIGTILPPGRHKVTCDFVSADEGEVENTLPVSLCISVEVVKKPPKIVWEIDPMTGALKATKKIE